MEVYTISGAPADGVEVLGENAETPGDLWSRLQAKRLGPTGTTPRDKVCAQAVKGTFIAGSVSTLGSVPVGLFGLYKTLRSGNRALGVTSLVGAAVLFGAGHLLLQSAAKRFQTCRGAV